MIRTPRASLCNTLICAPFGTRSSADPLWNDTQRSTPLGGNAGTAREEPAGSVPGEEFGPMVAALARSSSSGLAMVALDSGGEAAAAGGAWGKQGPVRRPSVQLTADSRCLEAGLMAGVAASGPAGQHSHVMPVNGVAGRQDSGGLEYAPDSKAVMARINRWWKRVDEGYMQPRFGGPALPASNPNPATGQGAGQGDIMHRSADSFSVPTRMVG